LDSEVNGILALLVATVTFLDEKQTISKPKIQEFGQSWIQE